MVAETVRTTHCSKCNLTTGLEETIEEMNDRIVRTKVVCGKCKSLKYMANWPAAVFYKTFPDDTLILVEKN